MSSGPSGPSGGGSLAVADLAALAALPTAALDDAVTCTVATLDDVFQLDAASTLPPDGITIVAAANGGNWLRRNVPSIRWRRQDVWFIDDATGDDENDGETVGTPLQTQQEWARRVGPRPLVIQTVTFAAGAQPGPYIWRIDGDHNNKVEVYGTRTVAFSGTASAVTQEDSTTNTPQQLSAVGLPAGLVGRIGRWTSGAASGSWFVFAKQLGEVTFSYYTTKPANDDFEPLDPAIGDSFEVYELTELPAGHVFEVGGEGSHLQFYDLVIGDPDGGTHQSQVSLGVPWFNRCEVYGLDCERGGGVAMLTCHADRPRSWEGGHLYISYTNLPGGLTVSGSTVTLEDCLSFGRLVFGFASTVYGWCGVFDSNFPVDVGELCQTNIWPWGTNNTGTYLTVDAAATYYYDAAFPPVITGSGTQASIGGVTRTFAQFPFVNFANGARAILPTNTNAVSIGGAATIVEDASTSITCRIGGTAKCTITATGTTFGSNATFDVAAPGGYINCVAPTFFFTATTGASGVQVCDSIGARYRCRTDAVVSTSSTGATTLATVAITALGTFDAGIVMLEGEVIAWRPGGGSQSSVYAIRDVVLENVGGTGTIINAGTITRYGVDLGTVDIAASGTGGIVRTTPIASTQTKWAPNLRVSRAGQ